MCLSTLKTCTINLEVERCAHGIFTFPESGLSPSTFNTRPCHIEKLSVQVSIKILYDAYSRDGIFEYLPTLTALAPHLQNLALYVARKERSGDYPGNKYIRSSYNTLLHDMHSTSIQTLIIDTCDVKPGSIRQCAENFFETISPITSLNGYPNLRRIVAPQEAFMSVSSRLSTKQPVHGVPLT
jgi:hypothetical protein